MLKVLGATGAPKRDAFAGEIDAFFRRQPAEGGFGLQEEGAVEGVFADDGGGGGGDPGAGPPRAAPPGEGDWDPV
jgi:hypothetical protein